MGIRVNTNTSSINAQNHLSRITREKASTFRKLASASRIAVAADDPAGLAISERLRSQIRSLEQDQRNTLDGVSLVQTAEGSLEQTSSILGRMRELSVQAANGTLSDADRAVINEEFQSLASEVSRISGSADFNGTKLLDGSAGSVSVQVGTGAQPGDDTVQVNLPNASASALGVSGLGVGSATDARAAISAIDNALDRDAAARGSLGATQNRLTHGLDSIATRKENLASAESRIRDADFAVETAGLVRNQILEQGAFTILFNANLHPRRALSLLSAT